MNGNRVKKPWARLDVFKKQFRKGKEMARSNTVTQSQSVTSRYSETDLPPQVRQRIADLAYRLYEERGRQPGHELEDWLEAERRVLGRKR